jgi:hypothetical protein
MYIPVTDISVIGYQPPVHRVNRIETGQIWELETYVPSRRRPARALPSLLMTSTLVYVYVGVSHTLSNFSVLCCKNRQ